METNKKHFGTAIFRIAMLPVCCIIMSACYNGERIDLSYEGCEMEDCEWPRIPLWWPYDIVEYGNEGTVGDWDYRRVQDKWWNDHIKSRIVPAEKDLSVEMDPRRCYHEWDQCLWKILDFQLKPGIICGRMLINETLGTCDETLPPSPPAYFIFASNMVHGIQFLSKERYLEKCREYGVDGNDLKSFEENWLEYWDEHHPGHEHIL